MYVSVVLINIGAYIKVHHPSENMDIYQVVGTDIYFDSVDGTYIKIEKHPFRIHNPYTISDVSEDDLKDIDTKNKTSKTSDVLP